MVRGAPDEALIAMANAWVALVPWNFTGISQGRTESLGVDTGGLLRGSF